MIDLKKLLSAYPLSPAWGEVKLFQEPVAIGGLCLQSVGLAVKDKAGMGVTGSAAEEGQAPLTRAYFELLERTSIIEAGSGNTAVWLLHDLDREPRQALTKETLFPKSPSPSEWNFARSNGVASQLTWEAACRSAELELIERDRVLRSWFGEIAPVRLDIPMPGLPQALQPHYELEAYGFAGAGPSVVALFGFPKDPSTPRACGFGCAPDPKMALAAATRECLQGLSFLWGEPLTSSLPEFSPTPDYHQDTHLSPAGIARVRAWLAGGHLKFAGGGKQPSPQETLFGDITPKHLQGLLVVAKAYNPSYVPLTFGKFRPKTAPDFPEELLIHPIA